jgi:hypothetical protein
MYRNYLNIQTFKCQVVIYNKYYHICKYEILNTLYIKKRDLK